MLLNILVCKMDEEISGQVARLKLNLSLTIRNHNLSDSALLLSILVVLTCCKV